MPEAIPKNCTILIYLRCDALIPKAYRSYYAHRRAITTYSEYITRKGETMPYHRCFLTLADVYLGNKHPILVQPTVYKAQKR